MVRSQIIIDALDVLCAHLTHDLFAIAKFFLVVYADDVWYIIWS